MNSYLHFHLREINWRIIHVLFIFILSFGICVYYYNEILLTILLISNLQQYLVLSSPYDILTSNIYQSLIISIQCITLPYFLLNMYLFIRPSTRWAWSLKETRRSSRGLRGVGGPSVHPHDEDIIARGESLSVGSDVFSLVNSFYFGVIILVTTWALPAISWGIIKYSLPMIIKLLLSGGTGSGLENIFIWAPNVLSILSLYFFITIMAHIYILTPLLIVGLQFFFCEGWGPAYTVNDGWGFIEPPESANHNLTFRGDRPLSLVNKAETRAHKAFRPHAGSFLKTAEKIRPFLLMVSLILIAILTPPDLISLLIIGTPFFFIFEISLFFAHLVYKYG